MKIDKHLNHALVEESRPPMYTAMKYWGKKPHNIWREFIECYSPENGTVLDPFAGSGIAAFEGVVANRKMITLDINPMSSFFIEVTTMPFNETLFTQAAHNIIATVEKDELYRQHYIRIQNNTPLKKYTGEGNVFSVTENPLNKAGSIWWFNEPAKYINYPDIPLSDRVDEAVLSILRRHISVRLDDIIAELFRMYPNGLTPDPRKISATLEKYAFQSSGKWKLKDSVSIEVTKHATIIMSDFTVNKKERGVQGDIVSMMLDIGFEFCGTTVLLQPVKPLYPFGYPYAYKINHHHQNIMTFRKNVE